MLNRILIQGRMTRDPEMRSTSTGQTVASFSLAVDRDFKSQSGERETDFIDCVAWRSTAEFVSKYFSKGQMALVEGRLQIRNWTDREGGKRRTAEVVVSNIYFAGSRRDSAGGGYSTGAFGGVSGAAPGGVSSGTFGSASSNASSPYSSAPDADRSAPKDDPVDEFVELLGEECDLPF